MSSRFFFFSFLLSFLLTFFSLSCLAQNLLADPSFENCDYGLTQTWKNLTGSVDLYDVRALKRTDGTHVKPHFEKTGTAHTGNFFAGKAFGWLGGYTEILITPLTKPLVAGQKYELKLWVRQPPTMLYQGTPISSIPVALWVQTSARDLISRQNYPYLKLKSVAFPLLYSREWTEVKGIYVARGGEKYLEIGSNSQKYASEIDVPYYYMDDVTIEPLEIVIPTQASHPPIEATSPVVPTVSNCNLVIDPSFEQAYELYGNAKGTFWRDMINSPDMRNQEWKPKNKLDTAHWGKKYIGIHNHASNKEALGGTLSQPLQKDSIYSISVYARLREGGFKYDNYMPVKELSIGFSLVPLNEKMLQEKKIQFIKMNNDAKNEISKNLDWQRIEGTYKAHGGEQYLTIGNPLEIILTPNFETYYYYDDISVSLKSCSNHIIVPSKKPKTQAFIQKNNTYTLENILFETNQSVLLPSSFVSLDSLVALLQRTPKKHIELQGHTDNEGNALQNQRLSEARAKAVADYLVRQGIDNQRVQSKGFGANRPIETNDTPEGRLKNRRVEFLLYFP